MNNHSYYSLRVGVSRHQRMSSQKKYSGAEAKIQAMTSRENKLMGLFDSYPRENGTIYRISSELSLI